LRQQRHYGRGQAILERRYPERFPPAYRMRSAIERLRSRSRSRGPGARAGAPANTVRYLSLPRPEPAALELAHQWGMPATLVLGLTAPLGLVRRRWAAPAAGGALLAATLFAIDLALAGQGRRRSDRALGVRARQAGFRLLRPLAFRWGHVTGSYELRGNAHTERAARVEALERPRTPRARSVPRGSS
jgi:hypothetical protein